MCPAPWDLDRSMFLAEAEVARLLRHLRRAQAPPRGLDRLVVEVLLFSGVRCSEFCRLAVRDVDADARRPSLTVVGSRNTQRCVWIPRGVGRLLAKFLRDQRPALLPDDMDPDDVSQPVFFTERLRPFERTGLYRRVVRILTEVGLGERASVQLLRHTYGYLAYRRTGGNLLFVQRQLGHAHPMITSIYARFAEEDYAALADQVAGQPRATTSNKGVKP